jgi:hypothetical protein
MRSDLGSGCRTAPPAAGLPATVAEGRGNLLLTEALPLPAGLIGLPLSLSMALF